MYPSIPRTAIPLWSPKSLSTSTPFIATGTASGALDASFSNDSILELWNPFTQETQLDAVGGTKDLLPLASLNVGSRFNRLAWGYVNDKDRPKGVIAAGLENGEIGLWDPEIMLSRVEGVDPSIARYDLHKGPVRGLDFNPHQTNLLASGATNGEIYIWDLTTPNKPFSPGTRSRSIDDITTLAWNSHVAHVLATGSNSGYTVVWDLKSKREVTALSYTANSAQGVGNGFGQPGWGGSGKRSVSAVQWHPNNPTKLATASDDDQHPVIMLWDLRNWKEPEKILTGHEKGILSLSWCSEDSDLLLSTGKDGRTLCWNPTSGDIVAEVAPSSNWSFDVQWCPRNPSLFSTASLDGKVAIHSIQQTTTPSAELDAASHAAAASLDGAGIFEQAISANATNYPTKSLTQTPKWLKRPASATFGFGGKLVTVANHSVGESKTPVVKVFKVVGEPEVVDRALKLESAMTAGKLVEFCEAKGKSLASGTDKDEEAGWKLLASLFGKAESRSELVEMLGYSKESVRAKVDEAIKLLARTKPTIASSAISARMKQTLSGVSGSSEDDDSTSVAREPLVTFADTPTDGLSASSQGEGAAANQATQEFGVNVFDVDASSGTATSDATTKLASSSEAEESETTEASVFGDDNNGPFNLHAPLGLSTPSTQQQAAAADFYSQIGSGRPAALPDHVFGRDNAANSSVAATIGSSSSVASVGLKSSHFKVFPAGEADVDKLITQALILGDFESAVELSLSVERYADAILLALRGGPELLEKTQKAYFERQASSLPYLRIFQSILTNDLNDVVQNADLADWQAIFVAVCTFAKGDEFPALAQVLGQRLERQYAVAKRSPVPEGAAEFRKNAVLCYLAAGNLEKVVAVWIEQMEEEEEETRRKELSNAGQRPGAQLATSKYAAHAKALQTFVEKVTIFQHAVGYVDEDLVEKPAETISPADAILSGGGKPYKLAALYDRYVEYAELLAAQGLVTVALRYIAQTPVDFQGLASTDSSSLAVAYSRDRLTKATGASQVFAKSINVAPVASTSTYSAPVVNKASSTPYQYPTQSAYEQRSYDNNQQQQPYGQSAPYAQAGQSAYSAPRGNNLDDPYGAYAPPVSQASYQPQQQQQQPYQSQQPVAAPYSTAYSQPPPFPNTGAGPYDAQASFVPAPPAIRESSPNFANRSVANVAPPPPRAKPDVQWNDAPVIARKPTPAAALASPKLPEPITSPFPNSTPLSPQFGGAATYGAPPPRAGQVPPPPPNRTGTRTSGAGPPPPQNRGFGQQGPPPPAPTLSPPPPQGYQTQPPRFAPPPPMPPPGQQQGPPRPPQQQQQQQQPQQGGPRPFSPAVAGGPGLGNFRGAPISPPNAYGARPPPPPNQGPYGQPPQQQHQQQQQQQQRGPPPNAYGPPPPVPNAGPYGAPPQPPRGFNQPPPPAPAPAPTPPAPAAPTSKYPPGNREHIPPASRPIFATLSKELQRLRQITPPQQIKIVNDCAKKLDILFDRLNCETLSEAAHSLLLEICRAIDAKRQPVALDLHIQLLTGTNDATSYQSAVKLIIQRMATS